MLRWIRMWLSRRQEDDDLSDELRAHLAIEIQQRVDNGESPEDAARAARRTFGRIAQIQEDTRADVGLGRRRKPRRRSSIWPAHAPQNPGLDRGHRADARLGSRPEHGHLQRGLRRPAAAPALSRRRPAGCPVAVRAEEWLPAFQRQRRTLACMAQGIDGDGRHRSHQAHRELQPHRRRHARASAGCASVVQSAARAGGPPSVRAHLHRRRAEERRPGGPPQLRVLAAPLWRRPRYGRPQDPTQRRTFRGHRRHAARVSLSQRGLRVVDASLHPSVRGRRWDELPVCECGPVEARRQPATGAGRVRCDHAATLRGAPLQLPDRKRMARRPGRALG